MSVLQEVWPQLPPRKTSYSLVQAGGEAEDWPGEEGSVTETSPAGCVVGMCEVGGAGGMCKVGGAGGICKVGGADGMWVGVLVGCVRWDV